MQITRNEAREEEVMNKLRNRPRTALQRFFEKVEVTETCWLWTAYITPPTKLTKNGYGMFWFEDSMRLAHRFLYKQLIGPIPEGLTLDHLCRVRHCVNVFDHLEPVTMVENLRRGQVGELNRAKTQCPAGHPYDEANTCIKARPEGGFRRSCRTCARDYIRRRRAAA